MTRGSTLGLPCGTDVRQRQLQLPAWFPTTTTAGVLEFSRPEQLMPTDHFPDHGYTWVSAAESDAAHATETDVLSQGYDTSCHPADTPAAFAALYREVCEDDIGGRPPVTFLPAGHAAHGGAAPPSWSPASISV